MISNFTWDWSFAWSVLPALFMGFKLTVLITLFGSVIAVVFGLVLCVVRIARIPVLSPAASWFVYFLRGTPFLIQLYFLFYILPNWGLTFSALATGIVGIGIYYAAFASELYRAGIEDVATGQWEAALTLGLPLRRVWFGVVLPQAVVAVIPMLGNLVVAMFKETAILSTITIMELLAQGRTIGSVEFRYIEPLTMVGVLYFIVSYSAARGIRRLEASHASN
jgi:polar amino acid transport system permease protein